LNLQKKIHQKIVIKPYIIHLLCTVKTGLAIIAVLTAPTAVYDQLTEPQSGIEWISSKGMKILYL
jgi:hypothetical protein